MGNKEKSVKEKPLEKMTVKELREMALEMPDITGAHGMNKPELIAEIKKVKGIADDSPGKKSDSVREVKAKIKKYKEKRAQALDASDARMATIYRRRISRLKKKTRKAA